MSCSARVDPDLCMASGVCVADAPAGFGFDAEGIAETLPGAAELGNDRLVRIARNCPAGAILLVDGDGNDVDPYA